MLTAGTTTLLDRIRRDGRESDWAEFVRRYWRVIYGVARRRGLSDAEAEDFTQDLLLELTRVIPGHEHNPARGTFRAFLRTLVERRLIDRLRRTVRAHGTVQLQEDGLEGVPESMWEDEWRRNVLRACLDEAASQVEPRTFQAFQLVTTQQMPAREVAEFLGMTIDSVYQARLRVMRLARRALERVRDEEGWDG